MQEQGRMEQDGKKRIGVVAADPLRSIGLEAILNEIDGLSAMPLGLEAALADAELAAVVLDGRVAEDKLIDLLMRARRESPRLLVIVLGESVDPVWMQAVIGAGAKGYLSETAAEAEIRMAMSVVLDGSVWAPRKVLARLIESGGVPGKAAAAAGDAVAAKMTPRELEVLDLLMDGRSNRDIAGAMGIDETTVKAHLGRMLRKTGASNRVELSLRAIEERGGRRGDGDR